MNEIEKGTDRHRKEKKILWCKVPFVVDLS